jgi:DNA-binding NarL/FixJ family response regulator
LDLSRNHSDRIDILITDINMGGMSGIELQRRIREERPETAVYFCSGLSHWRIATRLSGITEAIHAGAIRGKSGGSAVSISVRVQAILDSAVLNQ